MNALLFSTISLSTIRLTVFLYLHAKYQNFSILRNTVSDYGTGESRKLYNTMGILSLAAYSTLFVYLLSNPIAQQWLTIALGIAILGSVAILFFPTDRTGEKVTRTGRVHLAFAVLNFTALFIFMTNVQLPSPTPQADFLNVATWIVRISFYAFLVTLIIPKLRHKYIGLTERLFLTATPLWFITFAWLLFVSL